MYIEIESNEKTVRGMMTKNGQRYIAEQKALLFLDHENYPDKATLTLRMSNNEQDCNQAPALSAGKYYASDRCFFVNQYGQIQFRTTDLKPLAEKQLSKAS